MKPTCIVEFPSNLGLREPAPGKEPGVKRLPDFLRAHHFHESIPHEKVYRLEPPEYAPVKDPVTGILNVDAVLAYSKQQATMIGELLDNGKFPLVLGGDCSILTGSAIALKQRGDYSLFYLDGHTDFMDISFSQSGGMGGMAASMVTGNGHKILSDIYHLSPYIKEENLWCVGNREYDDEYENEVRRSNATYIPLHLLREGGISKCAASFLEEVSLNTPDGFWLHIDVDVLNDDIMPCVDSRTPDGLHYSEFNILLDALLKSPLLAGLEITILDPDLDPSGRYTAEFVKNVAAIVNERGSGQ